MCGRIGEMFSFNESDSATLWAVAAPAATAARANVSSERLDRGCGKGTKNDTWGLDATFFFSLQLPSSVSV